MFMNRRGTKGRPSSVRKSDKVYAPGDEVSWITHGGGIGETMRKLRKRTLARGVNQGLQLDKDFVVVRSMTNRLLLMVG